MESYKIITATIQHLEEIAPLFDAYRVFYEEDSDIESARTYLRARLENEDNVVYLAINENGKGFGFAQLYPTFASLAMKPAWILYDLFVSQNARRQGIGKALLERARALAEETNAAYLVLDTANDNHAAQALYESLGYERETDFISYFLEF